MHLLLLPILGFMIYFKRGKVTCLKSTCYIRPILYYLGHLFFVILLGDALKWLLVLGNHRIIIYVISLGKDTKGHSFCTEIKILNPGSRDISQKLRQTKCIIFKIWRLKCTIIPKKKLFCTWQFGKICVLVNLTIQKLKSKHFVCLSFWDISCDPGFRILISMQKMWPIHQLLG